MITGDESISATARGTQLLLTVGAIVLLAIFQVDPIIRTVVRLK